MNVGFNRQGGNLLAAWNSAEILFDLIYRRIVGAEK